MPNYTVIIEFVSFHSRFPLLKCNNIILMLYLNQLQIYQCRILTKLTEAVTLLALHSFLISFSSKHCVYVMEFSLTV